MANVRGHEEDEFLKMLEVEVSELEVKYEKADGNVLIDCSVALTGGSVGVAHQDSSSQKVPSPELRVQRYKHLPRLAVRVTSKYLLENVYRGSFKRSMYEILGGIICYKLLVRIIKTLIIIVLLSNSGCSLESQDAPLKLCQSVSDLVVGPGQRRYRVLHLPHCQGKLLLGLSTAVCETRLHAETPPAGSGGDLGPRHWPGGGVRHPPEWSGRGPDGGGSGQGGRHLGVIENESSTSLESLTPILLHYE